MINTETTTETTTIPSVIYTIARSDIDQAIERVKRANKRAARIGQQPYTCSFTEAEPMPVYDEVFDASIGGFVRRRLDPLYFIEMVDFTITGMIPRIGDWEVIAILEDDEHAGTISHFFPGIADVDLTSIKANSMECDHCHTTRDRIKTFVLRDQTGNLIKVGRNCLSLYTGITVSGNFDVTPMKLSDEMDELVTNSSGSGLCDLSVPVKQLLTLAVGAIKLHGWMSTSAARDMDKTSTADRVRGAYGRKQENHEQHQRLTEAADPARVIAVLDYVTTTLKGDGSEYVNNLIACTRAPSGLVSWSNFGLVVSAVSSYDRFMERQTRQATAAASQWVGIPGTREQFENVKVIDVRQLSGNWSNPDLVKMVTETGAVLTWFSSKGTTWVAGDIVTITARIKQHTEYQGCKETQLTFVKQI